MKKIIMCTLALQMLVSAIAFASANTPTSNLTSLPQFTGSINDPDCLVVEEGDGYKIVYYKGKYYIIYK
jgi:uncharacterized protein YraI